MQNKILSLLGLAFILMLIPGCGAFQVSTTQVLPVVADEKPTADQALVIVEGTSAFGGIFKLYAVEVFDNSTLVGKAGPDGKLAWRRNPGPMAVSVGGVIGRSTTAEAGKIYRYKINCNGDMAYSVAGPGDAFSYATTGQPTGPSVPYDQSALGQAQQQYNAAILQQQLHQDAQLRQQYNNSMRR